MPLINQTLIMEGKIEAYGVKVHYKSLGQGPNVVLLHGWGCNTDTFAVVQNALMKNFCVTAIDFPGFGQSDQPPSVWGVEEYTRCTEDLLQKLDIQNPTLIGHSFGGRVSILLSSRNPIKKIILTDAAGVKPQNTKISAGKVFSKLKDISKKIIGEKLTEKISSPFANKLASEDYKNASGIMKEILKKVVGEDLQSEMPKIKASTLLIWGANDTATPVSDAKIMEKLIPDAGLVVFPGCGHFSFLENSAYYISVVENFLKS